MEALGGLGDHGDFKRIQASKCFRRFQEVPVGFRGLQVDPRFLRGEGRFQKLSRGMRFSRAFIGYPEFKARFGDKGDSRGVSMHSREFYGLSWGINGLQKS